MRGRPKVAGREVAQITKAAPAVARRVLMPAGDREVAPAAVAAAGIGDHDVIGAVG